MNNNHKPDYHRWNIWLSAAITVVLAITTAPSFAEPKLSLGPTPYSKLAAAWWQWALETPASENPVLDTDGSFCGVNQQGKYWFLAGTFGGEAERSCEIPSGKSLFFPVVNTIFGAFLNDPAGTKSIGYMREQIKSIAKCTSISATVDDVPVNIVHERSIPFVLHLPDDNVFGATNEDIKNLMFAPSVDEGYYVLLDPLSTGSHRLVFKNEATDSCNVNISVTYDLTIQ